MRTQELVKKSGVSRRALRIYEAKGLVAPQRDPANGYRRWPLEALQRIHEIRMLQALGFGLAQIGALLRMEASSWAKTLAVQEGWLVARLKADETALARIRRARSVLDAGGTVETADLLRLVADANPRMEKTMSDDFLSRYYTPEQLEWFKNHPVSEEERKVGEQAWRNLYVDAERLKDGDPASFEAQALIKRWDALISAFTLGKPDIEESLRKLHADRENWPDGMKRMTPGLSAEASAFIEAARRHARGRAQD